LDFDDNYIPLTVTFSMSSIANDTRPPTVTASNLYGKNFIEFSFDECTGDLYQLSLITFEKNTVQKAKLPEVKEHKAYRCIIDEKNSILRHRNPMAIYRDNSSVFLMLAPHEEKTVKFYSLIANCHIGVNSNSFLTSVLLTDLSELDILKLLR